MDSIQIYSETPPKPKRRFLDLLDSGEFITLRLVGEDGKPLPAGALLKINKNTGRTYRFRNVSLKLGLDLDSERRVETN